MPSYSAFGVNYRLCTSMGFDETTRLDSGDWAVRSILISTLRQAQIPEISVQHAHIILRTQLLEEIAWRSSVAFHFMYPAHSHSICKHEMRALVSGSLEYNRHPVGCIEGTIRPYRVRVRNSDVEVDATASASQAYHITSRGARAAETPVFSGVDGACLCISQGAFIGTVQELFALNPRDNRCYELCRSSRREPP